MIDDANKEIADVLTCVAALEEHESELVALNSPLVGFVGRG